ncbi:MAG: Flp pilus assembly complex ATPase component TadA [Proteobacteria bacterium]|nr:Flp pilus assembly complex ATPase component TadA [Pseudomonadota bacterium]MBU1738797.1 Flp pilus assembly complex ATPase component TadA [Pseudomonadota bacterium]
MGKMNDTSYLFSLLEADQLISAEQREMLEKKLPHQKQLLLRERRKAKKGLGKVREPDLVEVIVSLNLQIPGENPQPLTEELIIRAVAADMNMPFKKLDPLELNLDIVTKTFPKNYALKHLLLPFAIKDGVHEVAVYDPAKRETLAEIERVYKITVRPYLSTRSDISRMLAEFFGFQSSISAAEDHLAKPTIDLGNLEQFVKIERGGEINSSDHHITSAVDHLFTYAFDQRASDIHIEPKRDKSNVRLRIDGILHTIYSLPKAVHSAIVSRIKTLSRLDIAEKRRPQDGRIKIDHEGKEAEIRVSTIPVAFGEKAVMRILDPDIMFQDLSSIGFSERDLAVYQEFMTAPHGIVLVTGPTGSGKSTTLYSTLKQVSSAENNVITVEDPVEMVCEEFNQIAVQAQIEVTFSTILRNILRQDPDIIMIGEIRDLDTAVNAIQAALTGHLVFSTLHTNDAVSSISRLKDLGAQEFLIGSTLLGAMAQRLVRRICPHCREKYKVSGDILRSFGFPAEGQGDIELQRGKGCIHCRGTGYLGRCGVFEIFPVSDTINRMICTGVSENEIRAQAIKEGMTTLKEDAWVKVKEGVTTYEEAARVTGLA